MLKSTILTLLLSAAAAQLFAHALWIETSPAGKSGKEHGVKVFYGEPGAGQPDKIADWWSDVSTFTLWLTRPDGSREQLEVSPQDDHFTAVFTPGEDGIYSLSISHTVEEIAGGTQYQFNSSARISVGSSGDDGNYTAKANVLDLYHDLDSKWKVNKPVNVSGLYQEQPGAGEYVSVYSPVGWSKQVKPDASGVTTFVPEWPGRYIIETGKGEKVSGKPYESIYRIATVCLEVLK